MKGIINKGIQDLIETEFGDDIWERVRARANCPEVSFSPAVDYPDEMTVALVTATAAELGLPIDDVLLEFGRFVVPNTLKNTYRGLYAMAGRSTRAFLKNMDRIHKEVTVTIPNAIPPELSTEDLPDGRLVMHYRSERRLCPALRGLIEGVGIHFGETVHVHEETCMRTGADECKMVIAIGEG
jgi:predicted hydrocarbon binding protein